MITHLFTVIPTMRLIFQAYSMIFILGNMVASQPQSSGKFKFPYIYLDIDLSASNISVYISIFLCIFYLMCYNIQCFF